MGGFAAGDGKNGTAGFGKAKTIFFVRDRTGIGKAWIALTPSVNLHSCVIARSQAVAGRRGDPVVRELDCFVAMLLAMTRSLILCFYVNSQAAFIGHREEGEAR